MTIVPCIREAIARRASESHEKGDTRNVNESLDNEGYGDLCARTNWAFDLIRWNATCFEGKVYVLAAGWL